MAWTTVITIPDTAWPTVPAAPNTPVPVSGTGWSGTAQSGNASLAVAGAIYEYDGGVGNIVMNAGSQGLNNDFQPGGGQIATINFNTTPFSSNGGAMQVILSAVEFDFTLTYPDIQKYTQYINMGVNLNGQVNTYDLNIEITGAWLNDLGAAPNQIAFVFSIPHGPPPISGTVANVLAPSTIRAELYYDSSDHLVHARILVDSVVLWQDTMTPDPGDFTVTGTVAFDQLLIANDFTITNVALPPLSEKGHIKLVFGGLSGSAFTFDTGSPPPPAPSGTNGPRRLIFDTQFRRFRNDSVSPTAILAERDTNLMLYSKQMTIGGVTGYAIVKEVFNQDYDDGGWAASGSPPTTQLQQLAIPLVLQTFFDDQQAPNHQKNYNTLTIDANPNGQTLHPILLFDDNNGTVAPVIPSPSTFTGSARAKFQFQIPPNPVGGLAPDPTEWGQEAYRAALMILGSVTAAPEIYEAVMYSAVLPDWRTVFDSYEIKFGVDYFKEVKQSFFDFTTQSSTDALTVKLYADGSSTPYYTFTLAANPKRLRVPIRVRHPQRMTRLFRLTVSSSSPFRLWSPIAVEYKIIGQQGKGYAPYELMGDPPQ